MANWTGEERGRVEQAIRTMLVLVMGTHRPRSATVSAYADALSDLPADQVAEKIGMLTGRETAYFPPGRVRVEVRPPGRTFQADQGDVIKGPLVRPDRSPEELERVRDFSKRLLDDLTKAE